MNDRIQQPQSELANDLDFAFSKLNKVAKNANIYKSKLNYFWKVWFHGIQPCIWLTIKEVIFKRAN